MKGTYVSLFECRFEKNLTGEAYIMVYYQVQQIDDWCLIAVKILY